MKPLALIALIAAPLTLAACGSSSPAATAAPPVAATTPATPAAACKLKVTFDYLVRTTEPGLAASAQEIGNVDFSDCTPTLQDFAQTAGRPRASARRSRGPRATLAMT